MEETDRAPRTGGGKRAREGGGADRDWRRQIAHGEGASRGHLREPRPTSP